MEEEQRKKQDAKEALRISEQEEAKTEREEWLLRLEKKDREEAFQRFKLQYTEKRRKESGNAPSQSSSLEEKGPPAITNSSKEGKCPSGSADSSLKDSVSHGGAREEENDATIRELTQQLEIKRLPDLIGVCAMPARLLLTYDECVDFVVASKTLIL
jgi:hypothetical protein